MTDRRLHFLARVADRPPPSKAEVARARPAHQRLFVHVDPRALELGIPDSSAVSATVFEILPNTSDLVLDDTGIRGALALAGEVSERRVPWSAVFALIGENDRGMLWPDSAPPTTAIEREATDEPWATDAPIFVQFPRYLLINGIRVSDRRFQLTVDGDELAGATEISWNMRCFSTRGRLCGELEPLLAYVARKRAGHGSGAVDLLLRCRIGDEEWTVQFDACTVSRDQGGALSLRPAHFYWLKVGGDFGSLWRALIAPLRSLFVRLRALWVRA